MLRLNIIINVINGGFFMGNNTKKILINSSVDKVGIDVCSLDVEITTVDDTDWINIADSYLICDDNVEVNQNNNVLSIKQKESKLKHNIFGRNNSVRGIVVQKNNASIVINGKIINHEDNNAPSAKLNMVLTSKNVYKMIVKNSCGNIQINDLKASTLDLRTVSGNINLENVDAEKSQLETVSGDINIKNINTSTLDLDMTSGDINISDIKASKLNLDATSGDIKLDIIDVLESRINAVSGDIRVEILESILNYCVSLSSVSGDTKQDFLESQTPTMLSEKRKLDIETVAGDIKVLFKGKNK